MLAKRIMQFLRSTRIDARLPPGVEVMNPYINRDSFELCRLFYEKFYADDQPRKLILGINPGRFGGGLTGVPFTDPVKLERDCGIPNSLPKKVELSADFIYTLIRAFGGPSDFYGRYFIGAMSPLGFTRDGKNLNYYDDRQLERTLTPYIIDALRQQVALGIDTQKGYCMGEGQNFKFLRKLNDDHGFFQEIVPLPHPRFIMQYRRRRIDEFVELYRRQLE